MIGGALFLVVEMKIGLFRDDNLAQLFLELLCTLFRNHAFIILTLQIAAVKLNKDTGFGDLRVHGLLTDLSTFCFYSYDPVNETFNPDEDILVNVRRDDFCSGMIYGKQNLVESLVHSNTILLLVGNKVFSVIMCAYVEGLRATVNASKKKSDTGDVR